MRGEVFPVIRGMLEDSWTVAQARRPELIVAHQKTLAAAHIAERLAIPHVQALTVPMLTPTREFPLPAMVHRDLGGVLNRASYRLVGMLTRPYSSLIRGWRSDVLALAPRGTPRRPIGPSTATAPASSRHRTTGPPTRWPPATGFAIAPRSRWTSSSSVSSARASLRSTSASEAVSGPTRPTGRSRGRRLAGAGARAVIATGWGGVSDVRADAEAMVVERAPHRWLFPSVAAVIHHGGAGTTASGLLAGRPTIVCPFQGDQYFWGAAVHRAGAGPEPMPAKKLTPSGLPRRSGEPLATQQCNAAPPRCRNGCGGRTAPDRRLSRSRRSSVDSRFAPTVMRRAVASIMQPSAALARLSAGGSERRIGQLSDLATTHGRKGDGGSRSSPSVYGVAGFHPSQMPSNPRNGLADLTAEGVVPRPDSGSAGVAPATLPAPTAPRGPSRRYGLPRLYR